MKNTKNTIIAVLFLVLYALSLQSLNLCTLPTANYVLLCNLTFLAIINSHLIDLSISERVLSLTAMGVIVGLVCALSLFLPLAIPTIVGMGITAFVSAVKPSMIERENEIEASEKEDDKEGENEESEGSEGMESMLHNSNIQVVTMQPNEFFRLQQVMKEVNKILFDTKNMQLAKISMRLVDSCMGALNQYQRGNIPQTHVGVIFDEIASEFSDLETLTSTNTHYTDDLEVAQRFKKAIQKLTA